MNSELNFNFEEAITALDGSTANDSREQLLRKIAAWLRQVEQGPCAAKTANGVLTSLRNAVRSPFQLPGLYPRVLITVSGGVADYVADNGIDIEIFDHDNYKVDPEPWPTGGVPPHFADLLPESSDVPIDWTLSAMPETGDTKAVALAHLQHAMTLAMDSGLLHEMQSEFATPGLVDQFASTIEAKWRASQPEMEPMSAFPSEK